MIIAPGLTAKQHVDQQDALQPKVWRDKNGKHWHYRTDHQNRLLTYKRIGSVAPEMRFLYDEQSGKPIAARLGDGEWFYATEIRAVGAVVRTPSCEFGMSVGRAPKITSMIVAPAMQNLAFSGQTPQINSFRYAYVPGDEEDQFAQQLNAAYQDLQWFMEGMYREFQFDDFARRSPEERQRCVDACNNVTDLAWLSCGSFALLGVVGGPAGALLGVALGVGCGLYFYDRREQCRRECMT